MSWLAQNFDFTRGDTIVRLIAGIFLIPHVYSKLVGSGTVGFFKAAGFKPPAFWMYVACVIEVSVAVSFLSNMYARYFGVLGAVHLLIAGAAVCELGARAAGTQASSAQAQAQVVPDYRRSPDAALARARPAIVTGAGAGGAGA